MTAPREERETAGAPEFSGGAWDAILGYLRDARGFDFSGYKRSSLERRLRKRMDQVGVPTLEAYQDFLEVHPDEFTALFNTILINVTSFFRDAEAWDALRDLVVRPLVASTPPDRSIRIWSAGCASGEEAYSLAMLFAQEAGDVRFQEQVKIYATDMDEEALAQARRAVYSDRQMEGVSPELLERYFERADGGYVFRKHLRRQVIFGRHDLLHDAPISRVQLLTCRNTLMYFNAETQSRILARFHFALNDGGILVLGRAETMLAQAPAFHPIDLKRRVFAKAPASEFPGRLLAPVQNAAPPLPASRIHEAALSAVPVAQVIVDGGGRVALTNERARSLFGLTASDLGRPLQDLQLSYRPVELRGLIDQAAAERRPIAATEAEWRAPGGALCYLDVQVMALRDPEDELVGTSITFTDVTAYKRLQRELEHSNQALETAYEELQSTNEELETTNEELQSTVEELETTNEELQSTNEELETMNEELQSTNEELHTMNDEMRLRGDDLDGANAFLDSVLTSLRGGVAVVDRELRVLAWSRQAEDLWGVRANEAIGQHLLNLDIGLPTLALTAELRACLAGEADHKRTVLDAVNRRGRRIRCSVACSPLTGPARDVRGVILLMEETMAAGPSEAPGGDSTR